MKRTIALLLGIICLLFVACGFADTTIIRKDNSELKQREKPAPTIIKPPLVAGTEKLLIPILVYHRISVAPADSSDMYKLYTIDPAWFDKHLAYLRDNGFTIIHFSDLTNYLEKGIPLPARPVMINFDDGYKDFYTNAFPLLKKYNATATVFMVSGSIGYGAYLNLDQLKELAAYGIEIGAHSITHPSLTKVKNANEEITKSKKVLEDKLGVVVTTFAYPNGSWNDEIVKMVKAAGFSTARSFANGKGISNENLFHLPVVQITKNIGLENWSSYLYPEGHP